MKTWKICPVCGKKLNNPKQYKYHCPSCKFDVKFEFKEKDGTK